MMTRDRVLCAWVGRHWLSLAAGLSTLAIYAQTLAPGLTWAHDGADGGDFLAAALTRGVPHPPGYPTYQLLLRAVISRFPEDPARVGNWVSAICAALAVALLADLIRLGTPKSPWRGMVALVAALAWGVSPTLWSQAVITEVYALNALIVVLELAAAWRWRQARATGTTGTRWLVALGLTLGLGLGNHLSLVLVLPGLALWLWDNRKRGRVAPTTDLVRAGLTVLPGLALGLTVYAYLPWTAAGHPPVNWGDPSTPARFWQVVSAAIYRDLPFGVALHDLPGRLAAWVAEALRQLGGGPWGALLALAGLWQIDNRDHAWWRFTSVVAVAYSIYAVGYDTADAYVYLIPVWAIAALWLAAGLNRIVQSVLAATSRVGPVVSAGMRVLLVLLLLALPGLSLWRFWEETDLSQDRLARDFLEAVWAEADPGAVILTATDEPTFALWYAVYGLRQRPDLILINTNLYVYPWYKKTLAYAHPALLEVSGGNGLPTLDRLLTAVARQRPVYRAEALSMVFPSLVEKPVGTLTRLIPQ